MSSAHAGNTRALAQRERSWHVFHSPNISPLCLPHPPARIGGERLDVAPGPLRIQHAEGQRGLATARDPGNAHKAIERNTHVQYSAGY